MRGVRGALVLLLVAAAYVVASLWPFRPWNWDPPREVVNAAARTADGGVDFAAVGVVGADRPPGWLQRAIGEQRLRLRLVAQPQEGGQHGPARLLSIAPDPYLRNLTIGQEGADLVLRIRAGGPPGAPRLPDGASVFVLPEVFAAPAWVELELEVGPGRLRLLVDGSARINVPVGERPLACWDAGFPLSIGNEASLDRPWLGTIGRAVVEVDGQEIDLLTDEALAASPRRYWIAGRAFDLVPFAERNPVDEALNLVGYVPLGWVLGTLVRRRSGTLAALVGAAVLIALFSASLELLQYAVQTRHSSVTDLILNALGGAVGLALAHTFPARRLT
jgi:hypothetical protein